ncbi:hypothetical protein BN1723_017393 [Verticillium longisporum]|uniref:Amidase domain-containing protein n=1 Tax=Verticillium longisporum TaxID=100787 RepID=A0A0G4KYH2_VERLO|nr:hypothetical protein BN1723_017393 [Verticillium longisporum]
MAHELYRLTASEVAARVRSGQVTIEEYARSLLSRIEARDPVVKAWAYLDPERVIAEARRLDQVPLEERGPLHGVAIGVKDVIYTKADALKTCPRSSTRPSMPTTHPT